MLIIIKVTEDELREMSMSEDVLEMDIIDRLDRESPDLVGYNVSIEKVLNNAQI